MREDFEKAEVPPMVQAAFLAWHHIAVKGPWLASFTSSQMLERRNNPDIVKDGGMSYRIGKKFENELGISLKRMISLNVHSTADTEHSDMMDGVYDKHVRTQEGLRHRAARRRTVHGHRPRLPRRAGLRHAAHRGLTRG